MGVSISGCFKLNSNATVREMDLWALALSSVAAEGRW